jgi:CheY-like chemotaxis protein
MDVVILDISMPVMDGFQFLRLLSRTYVGQQIVMLTGRATEEARQACQEGGAALLLEKPVKPEGFADIFAAIDALSDGRSQSGFRGIMQRVGLQEVLQLECLGRKSSVLEIFTGKTRGRVFICDGSIIHAQSGLFQGEVALYGLLALRGGEFNLLPFVEPAHRTIAGHWEFLLMEAARLIDEGTTFFQADSTATPPSPPQGEERIGERKFFDQSEPGVPAVRHIPVSAARIDEVALCSGAGEVLYDWQCNPLESRLRLLEQVETQAAELSASIPIGRFDRLEILTAEGRIVCQVQPDRRLFVRSSLAAPEPA